MREPGDDPTINYLKSHIKGAQYLDLFNLKDHSTNLPLMMPNEAYFVAAMKRLNVKLSDNVVCYDTGKMQFFGYRAAWMLQAMGHPNTRVLDGGFDKWTKEGRPTESTDGGAAADQFAYKLNPGMIKTGAQMKAFAGSEAERTY